MPNAAELRRNQNLTANPETEVRTCARCHQPALICLGAWKHSVQGIATRRVTRECRCQSCGAFVKLHDPSAIRGVRIAAFFLLPFVFISPFYFVAASRRARAWRENPLAPGAPYPEVRYKSGPGDRRCGQCGKVAKLVSVTRHRHNGIPTGVESEYACQGCGRTFETESVGGLVFSVIGGALLGSVGVRLLASHQSAGLRFGAGGILSLGGAALLYQAISRIAAALRNPTLE